MKSQIIKYKFLSLVMLAFSTVGVTNLGAQEIKLGAQVGALSIEDDSEIGYGAHLNVNPYSWAAFQVDFTAAQFSESKWFFSSSPGVVLYPVYYDEFRLGVVAGPGFYRLPQDETKFGLHAGIVGDFSVTQHLVVGMESRYHPIFDSKDVWTVLLTVGYKFEADGGW